MTNKTDYIKIRVFKPIKDGDILVRNNDGTFIGSPEFTEQAYEADQLFREPIITHINDQIGPHGWAIRFTQFDETARWFDAYLYCSSETDALIMVNIIKEKIPNIRFNYFYKGDIYAYLKR